MLQLILQHQLISPFPRCLGAIRHNLLPDILQKHAETAQKLVYRRRRLLIQPFFAKLLKYTLVNSHQQGLRLEQRAIHIKNNSFRLWKL
ncbi:hypothetical protein D3C80_1386640 [compost metagenome]